MAAPPRILRDTLLAAMLVVVTVSAASASSGPVTASAAGGVAAGGTLQPVGDGRFRVSGREYQARLASDDTLGCLRGQARVTEDAVLSVPHYAGQHEGIMAITSDVGSLHLQYRGSVDRYNGKGDWWVVRGTGACTSVGGVGSYVSALRAAGEPEYRLELRGRLGLADERF